MRLILLGALLAPAANGLSSFHGNSLQARKIHANGDLMFMRKQKASNRRTRNRQLGEEGPLTTATITTSPMQRAQWSHKKGMSNVRPIKEKTGGRNRSRKRSMLYNSLSSYHNHFLQLLTAEYKAEVSLLSLSFS